MRPFPRLESGASRRFAVHAPLGHRAWASRPSRSLLCSSPCAILGHLFPAAALDGQSPDPEAWRALKALEALQRVKGYAVKRTVFVAALGDPIALQTVQRFEVGKIGQNEVRASL